MGILTGGWVSVTNGTTTVTFGGGFELEANRVAAGDTIAFGTEPWASWHHITSVDYGGNTAQLGANYGGTTLNQSPDFAVNSPGSAFTVPDVHARLKSLIEFLDDFLPAVDGADSVLTLDKDAAGDDAGLVLRTAAGERWRVGAFGNDDLRIWRSPDGAAWTLAATVSRSTGAVTIAGTMTIAGTEAYRRGNILGTASQSGGTPTGSIIERGSNANGSFVRLADGTQICSQTIAFDTADDPGGIKLYPYPASFIGGGPSDHVDLSIRYQLGGADVVARRELAELLKTGVSSVNGGEWWVRANGYSGGPIGVLSITLFAFGRWF